MEFNKDQELNPAIRFNLLLFKEKSKRISTIIGARAAVARRRFGRKEEEKQSKNKTLRLCAFARLIKTPIKSAFAS